MEILGIALEISLSISRGYDLSCLLHFLRQRRTCDLSEESSSSADFSSSSFYSSFPRQSLSPGCPLPRWDRFLVLDRFRTLWIRQSYPHRYRFLPQLQLRTRFRPRIQPLKLLAEDWLNCLKQLKVYVSWKSWLNTEEYFIKACFKSFFFSRWKISSICFKTCEIFMDLRLFEATKCCVRFTASRFCLDILDWTQPNFSIGQYSKEFR